MAEGGQRSIGGEDNDIPYADADEGSSGKEESHNDRRGIKDEISTSGDQGSFDIGKAWETLKFQIYIKKTLCEYEATKQVDMCKLQFVLESKYERIDFLRRFTEDMEFEVVSAGVVKVSGDFDEKKKIEAVWSTLIMSVNDALGRQVVECHHFQSRREFENILQELDARIKRLIEKGIVRIFTSYEDTTYITKFVGAQTDIETLNKGLYHVMANKKRSCTGKSDEFDISIDISFDEGIYFETMKLNEQFLEKFPHVRLEIEENNSRAYKFTCSDENDLVEAINWFKGSMNKMSRFELDFSSKRFINISESVQFYLQKCLHKVPADLRILSDRMYILCCKSNLQSSEQIVADSIKCVEIEGSWFPEAEKIQKDSRGKIQVFTGNEPGMIIIWYTVDKSAEAKELENLVKKYKKCKKKPYSDKEIKAMKALDVIKELQEEYEDILIRTEDADVILQGSEMDRVDACLKKLDTALQRIEIVELNSLPELQQKLLQNGKVQKYVADKIKRKIAICVDGKAVTGFVFKRETEKSKSSIYLEIKNCFVEKKIDTQWLEHGKGKSFVSEHPEEVVIEDQGNKTFCNICCTADLGQEIQPLLYSYSKSCTGIVANCLQLFGDECCKELEKQNNVGIEIKNDKICVKGPYNRAKSVTYEIESHVNTTVMHFGKLDYQRNVLFTADKNQIDSIAKSCKCCWKADVFRYEQTQLEEKGIDYLCTWNLPQSKEQISIAKIDYNIAKLDGLIIPVNECLWGEDINGKGIRMYYDVQGKPSTQELGYSKELVLTEKYPCSKYVALVTSEVGKVGNKQTKQYIDASQLKRVCADIFDNMFRKGLFRVGFALPTSDTNLVGKLEAVIDGFQDITQFYDNMPDSELIFGVKTEAERWMQEVDYISTLKFAPYARRYISPRYKGLLSSPSLSVQIQKKSILETRAHCIVVAISRDLDLSKGYVSQLVNKACGEQLQEELHSKDVKRLDPWELVMCQSYNLSQKGIMKVIFGFIPPWPFCEKLEELEVFVEDCLLLADSAGCSTVAIPVLGTGKLGYPLQDVAVTLFKGVDRYVSEGTIGAISSVCISVPIEEEDVYKILKREEERRKSFGTYSGEKHTLDDQQYLAAESESIKYSITTKSVSERMNSGKFVNVKFEPVNYESEEDISIQIGHIIVKCVQTKAGLWKQIQEVVVICEKEKITHLNIFCSNGFKGISEAAQVEIFSQSVEEKIKSIDQERHPAKFKYLKNVRIIISDVAFSTECESKCNGKNVSKMSLYNRLHLGLGSLLKGSKANVQFPFDWKPYICHSPKRRQCLNVTLAGCKDSDLERAKDEITQYIEGIEYCDVDPDTILDEVSAELNLGIVKYLAKLSSEDFQKWKKELSQAFKVYFWISKDTTKIEIRGAFSSILETEQYFETGFPKSPLNTKTGLDFKDQHFVNPKLDKKPASKELLFTNKYFSNTLTFTKASYQFKGVDVTIRYQDITDLHVDCIVCPLHEGVKADRGIAKVISEKAGKTYTGECAVRFGYRPLDLTKCEVISSGNLSKCKKVMHVRSPEKFDHTKQTINQLSEIKESVENCLTEADKWGFKSIAIPFLGIDENQYPTELCAQEYFRAFYSFNRQKYLEKVFLVDNDKVKVSSVCSRISKCCKGKGIYYNDATTIMTIPNESSVKFYAVEGAIYSIESDVVVIRVDENFHGYGKEIPELLSCSSNNFKLKYEEQRKVPHKPTSVTPIHSDGVGFYKHALFVVTPKWGSGGKKDYEIHVRITMKHILETAENLKASSLALPILCLDDDSDATTASCNAIVKSILEYFTNIKGTSCVKTIQLLADKRGITNFVDAMICRTEGTMV